MAELRRFSTLEIGHGVFEHADYRYEFEVRLVVSAPPAVFHLVAAGALGEPRATAAAARADAPAGVVWRSDLTCRANEQPCPICRAPTYLSPRYPRHLCTVCELEAVDAEDRPLHFANVDLGGGFRALLEDGSEVPDGHVCFVRGVRCRAGEARFGGIVIEPDEPLA